MAKYIFVLFLLLLSAPAESADGADLAMEDAVAEQPADIEETVEEAESAPAEETKSLPAEQTVIVPAEGLVDSLKEKHLIKTDEPAPAAAPVNDKESNWVGKVVETQLLSLS